MPDFVTIDDFLSVLSHGLRTPLNTILMSAQLLEAGHPNDPLVVETVAAIVDSVGAQARLLDESLDVCHVLSGRISLVRQPMDVAEAARSVLAEMASVATEKGVALESAGLAESATVQADLLRIRQILKNLLSNAVKFTPAGGRVKLALDRLDGQLRVAVSDTGEGLAPEILPVIFEPSGPRNASGPRLRRSLGVGLAVVQRLVEMHGGTVQAHSEGLGQGATFSMTLPATGPSPA